MQYIIQERKHHKFAGHAKTSKSEKELEEKYKINNRTLKKCMREYSYKYTCSCLHGDTQLPVLLKCIDPCSTWVDVRIFLLGDFKVQRLLTNNSP